MMMTLLTESLFVELLVTVLLVSYFVYWFITNKNSYWDHRGVPNTKGGMLINSVTGRQSQRETVREWYNKFAGDKYFGFVLIKKPALMIRDLELIHQIMVKDFTYFQDRGQPQNKKDPMTNNLFSLKGQVWRDMRYKLTPTFTTGKLKGMFEQVSKCGSNMIKKIEELMKENPDIESKDFLFDFTSDVIASCAFGIQFEPNSPEFIAFKATVQNIFKPSFLSVLKVITFLVYPELAETLNLSPFMGKKTSNYFLNLIKETAKYRKENNIQRNDYLQLLLTLKEQEDRGLLSHPTQTLSGETCEDDEVIDQMKYTEGDQPLTSNMKMFTDETVCANSVIFLVAGSESTSSNISLTLFELARHPKIQQQLQLEVDAVLTNHNRQWSYQLVKEMVFLDQVIQESLRMYPLIPFLQRECTKTYKIPGSDLVIEKGTMICIPVTGLHYDPQYYPDPDIFRPERFLDNNFKPNPAYLPFGDGPRICIAMRFAVMELKTSIARIMENYTVKLSPKTKVPLQLDPRAFVPLAKGGLWLTFEKRQEYHQPTRNQ